MQYIKTIPFFLFLLGLNLTAQQIYKDYDWEKTPKLHQVSEDLAGESELILKEKHVSEFVLDEEVGLKELVLEHTITLVNSDLAIERNNRIYLPLKEQAEIIKQKARVITPAGKVIELKEEDIQEAETEDGRKFRYFALKGLEVGCEVEYLVQTATPANLNGQVVRLQNEIPKQDVSFEVISPSHLVFDHKGYNGFGEMEQDTSSAEHFYLKKSFDFISPAKKEEQAVYEPNLMHVIFKLGSNASTGADNLVNYDDFTETITTILYTAPEKKVDKMIDDLIKGLPLKKMTDQERKIRKLDAHIKTNFAIMDIYAPELGDLGNIMTYKQASPIGILRLYTNILDKLGIKYNLVFTTDRSKIKFDREFEAYSFLNEYLIYFPDIDKYLPPTDPTFCLGIIPPNWSDNYGLFINPKKVENVTTGTHSIKYIDALDHEGSKDNMLIQVKVKDRFPNINVHLEKEVFGYYAQTFQPLYSRIPPDFKEELDRAQVQWINEDMEIESVEVINTEYEDFGKKPMIVKTDFTSRAFIESAGNKFIFKIGELIGPQMEMYQEEERKFPVEQSFNRFYHRIIEFEVPEGYKVSNLETLKFDIVHKEDGKKLMAFESDYTLEGNQLRVICDEFYTKNKLPLELFEEYRKVINAAADFNKVVLYLEKE